MTSELPTAKLTVSRLNGPGKTWRVQLTPQTPLGVEELKVALVRKFVGVDASPADYNLRVSGTVGSPMFELDEEEGDPFGPSTEI